jgi:hypothetical protein
MKKPYLVILSLFLLLCSVNSRAQTTLSAGDIVIVGWNSTDNTTNTPGNAYTDDDIDFILLRTIAPGTPIYFTDLGWTGTGFQQNENNGCGASTGAITDGCIKWTSTALMTAGTQVRIGVHFGLIASTGTVTSELISFGANGGPGSANPPRLSLATTSDEIFAFQGSLSSPTLIAAVHYGSSWAGSLTACQTTSTQSTNPGASVGGYAFLYTSGLNNNYYSGSPASSNPAALRTAVLNAANWAGNDITTFVFPIAATFTLPVHLISFDARKTSAGNVLEWKVVNEENFGHYEVESSTDGVAYNVVGTVAAAAQIVYSFTATPVQVLYQLYRLKLVDLDGKYAYSKVIRVENASSGIKIVVFPNPAVNSVTISSGEPILSLSLTDISGKKCLQQKGNDNNSTSLDIANLKAGIYILTVITKSGVQTERIYKKSN